MGDENERGDPMWIDLEAVAQATDIPERFKLNGGE